MAIIVLLMLLSESRAQYTAVPVTGFTHDVIAEGNTGTSLSTTTAAISGDNKVIVANGFQPSYCASAPSQFLPSTFTSPNNAGLTFSVNASNVNNAIVLTAAPNDTASLYFPSPISASNIYLLATAGSGAGTILVTITFTDLTTQTSSPLAVVDWYQTAANYTLYNGVSQRIGRVTRDGASCGETNTGTNIGPNLYQVTVPVNGANYNKSISSISIKCTNSTNSANIVSVFAVSVQAPCTAPTLQPTGLYSPSATTSSISGSFTDASTIPSGYLVVRYPQGATTISNPDNGTIYTAGQALGAGTIISSGTSTTFTANGLSGSTSYDFYVYSYNTGASCGGPVYLTSSPAMATLSTNACGASISGTIGVGPFGTYSNLTAALTAINASGLASNTILELQAGYDASTETYPLTFPLNPCISSSKTLTIRPASGIFTTVIITSNNATATIDINGATYVTFDGRPGGVGSSKMLSIINTSATGVAVRFINDASFNTFTHCDIQGQNTSATSNSLCGVIYFSTANSTLLMGNDNNTIAYCDIHSASGGFSAIGIASYGNNVTTPVTAWNENNLIDHCNIFDFFSATLASTAIKLDGGSHAFTISNNHVYQTSTRTFTTGNQQRAFWLTPSASGACGFQVLNNFIGGNDSLGAGTWTLTGSVVTNFWGMDINHSGVVPTSVQGNTITGISLTSTTTTANDLFRGISTGNNGHVYIGTINGNTIGSATTNGAITLVTSGTGSNSYGIKCGSTSASSDTIRVHNNIISGIQTSSSNATNGANLFGIGVTSGSYTYIENNTVGSLVNPNSLYSSNVATSTQSVYGISVAAGIYTSIVGNTVANVTNNYTGTSTGYTRGITLTSSTTSQVTGNMVKNVSTNSTYTGSGTTAALTGIQVSSGASTISGNTVDSLVLAHLTATSATVIEGMYVGLNGSTPTHMVTKNMIGHLMVMSPNNSNAIINGLNVTGGSNIIANNMIQLGIKTDGSSSDSAHVMRGLYLNTTTANNVYHNTVYIGGTNVGIANKNTFAFVRNATSGTHEVRNNIFVNQRSNATTGGKHYQIYLNNITGLSLSNNVYYGTGTGNVMGSFNNGSSDIANITSGWTNIDTASAAGDPQLINPNGGNAGSFSPVNLHINNGFSTPVEGAGILVSAIADDYDGNNRAANTPVDIGADAGLFIPIGMSIDSTVVEQITAALPIGAINQQVIAIKLYAKGNVSPLTLTSLKLNTSGTTNPSGDLLNAKVYFTGPGTAFNTVTQYGATVVSPNGTFYMNGSQQLSSGLNCFWVAYDTKSTATGNDFIDARLDSVGLSGNAPANVLNGDPAGARKISSPMMGNYDVGVSQTYSTITAAIADLNLLGISGPVTFTLKDAAYSANETFPITISAIQGSSSTNTVAIMPDFAVTSTISANVSGPVVLLSGVNNFIIDGRQGGVGSSRSIIIKNDHTAGAALTFINDASNNILRYATFQGASTNTVIGVINFATGVVTGNDNNLIEHCGIGDAASLPTTLIQARGSFDATSKFNNGNIIRNCDLYNYWNASGESNAMKISKGNAGWLVKGNSFYQTAARTFANIHYTFNWNRIVDDNTNTNDAMAAASLTDMVVEDNYFGGSASMCGGTPWTETSSLGAFCSYFNMGDSALNYVRRNVFANFSITSTHLGPGSPGAWNAIQFIGGKLHIDSNIIGSSTDTNSISFAGGNGNVIYPIACTGGAAGSHRVNGNVIGGIRAGGNGTTALNIHNIFISSGSSAVTFDIENNNVGALPIKLLGTTSTTPQVNIGINSTNVANLNIRNNIIHNLGNEQSSTANTQTIGVKSVSAVTTVTGNIIDSLSCYTLQTSNSANAAVIGVSLTATSGNSLVDGNVINRLYALNSQVANVVSGIYYAGGSNDVLSRNMIRSFGSTPSPAAFVQNGIQVNGGTPRVQNNMIRLGIDAAGFAQTDSSLITGISVTGGAARVFFNSVYIGGTGASGSANTFAINRSSSGADSIYNNIFTNERSGGTGNHYSIALTNSTSLKSNYNLFYNPGGVSLGLFNGNVQTTVVNWKQASGVDGNSNSGNPSFINPAGDFASMNMHISSSTPTPVEGSGLLIPDISNDFDGDSRSSFTPSDIGADAGNFILSDIFAPAISYTEFGTDTVHSSLILNAFATITDASGVDVSTNIPRIYYKKKSDNNVFGGNTSFDNGWKYVSASNTSSPFSFTIDYTIINGGSIIMGDTIQYFVVAQDNLGNVGANPAGGFSGFSVSAVSAASTNPSFYRIKGSPLNGLYNIGQAQTAPHFSTITNAIAALNDVGVSGAVTFNLMDASYSTNETFPLVINAISGATATNTVTIKPAATVNAVISGSVSSAIIILNGADYVIIDGSNNGTNSKDLVINNTNAGTASAVIWAQTSSSADAATNNTIKNTVITGNSRTSTLFGIGFGGTTISNTSAGNGNHANTINNCLISKAQIGYYSFGNSASNKNSGNTILNSSIQEISKAGIYLAFENNAVINQNVIRDVLQTSNTVYGITLGTLTGNTGTPTGSEVTNATITNNIIDSVVTTAGWSSFGLMVTPNNSGTHTISNNMLSRVLGGATPNDFVAAVYLGGGGTTLFNNNSVYMTGSHTTSRQNFALAVGGNNPMVDIRNNILINNTTGGTVNSYAIGFNYATFTNLTCDYNNYINAGSNAQFAVTGNLFGGTNQATLAALKIATGKDANSKSVAVTFNSASDLHLVTPSNGDVNLIATPIAGLTTDIDGNIRNAQYPYMGADEASIPLPVKLIAFNASLAGNNVVLTWSTADEINNRGFEIERSVDGKTFLKIGFVKGKGNSSNVIHYDLTDESAFIKTNVQTLYYRLRQVDFDGKQVLSNVVLVNRQENNRMPVQVYPNPFSGQFNIQLNATEQSDVNVEVYDMHGRIYITKTIALQEGANLIRMNELVKAVSGIYFVKVINNGNIVVTKIIKQ